MRIVEFRGERVFDYQAAAPADFPPVFSAVTVGSYDGVHVGHRKIISRMVEVARSRNLRSVVVTFEPHPRLVLQDGDRCRLRLLTTLQEKTDQIAALGVDLLCIIRFDREFAAKSSESFIRQVLVGIMGAKFIVVGYDHSFGRDRSGSGDTLHELGKTCGFGVEIVGEIFMHNEHISSTRIRELLEEGRIGEANTYLGAPYVISGTVVDGEKRGRELGFPTVNLDIPEQCKLLPSQGVYAVSTSIGGRSYRAMMNIGVRPTVSLSGKVTVEAHLIGFSGDLYGKFLSFSLLGFIRNEKRFGSVEALTRQLVEDKKMVELYQE
jgi:riboflavin kinase/FMN adenylyltransferase